MYAIELLKILGAYELSTNSLDKNPTKTKKDFRIFQQKRGELVLTNLAVMWLGNN